jgi:two-component system phosphate regulon response regulator PhoB
MRALTQGEPRMPKRILIVDDNEDTRQLFAQTLSGESYEVTLANDGDEALRKVGWTHPDLILLDLMMPGVDGLRVCRALKQNPAYRPIPILMISAKFADPASRQQAVEAGAEEILIKPIDPSNLLAKIKTHLNKTDPA